MNRAFISLTEGSLEITSTVPLSKVKATFKVKWHGSGFVPIQE